jgi:homoserine kinase
LRKLNAQLATARKAEGAAGRALASVISGAGLTVTRDATQAASQITTLVGRLAKQGLSRAKIKTIDSTLLTPQPGDWLTALAAG